MQGAVSYGVRDIRFEDRAEPTIVDPTDAIISLPVTTVRRPCAGICRSLLTLSSTERSSQERCSTSCCRSIASPRAIGRWTSAVR